MIFSIPDVLICGPHTDNHAQKGCEPNETSTSHRNVNSSNVMGRAPDGKLAPNGIDFWWDEFPGNTGNCWYLNEGPQRMVSSPPILPNCDEGRNPDSSVGRGNEINESELSSCLAAFETRNFDRSTTSCPWLFTPPKPKPTAEERQVEDAKESARWTETFARFCSQTPEPKTCEAYSRPFGLR
jgi:hypothetical protein